MIAVSPTAARNSSRPTLGHPPGNVEKNLCSPCPLEIRSCASGAPYVESNGLHRKVNPRNSESFDTTFVALPGGSRILFLHSWMIPRRTAIATASVRSLAFRDEELFRDVPIPVPAGDALEYLYLALGQCFVAKMFGELGRRDRRFPHRV